MEEPEKDPEFSVYFTARWSDMLRVTLNNFLSTILLTAPLPKVGRPPSTPPSSRDLQQLMLLERWFRSEAQQEIRVQLKQASDNVDHLLTRLKSYEERLTILRGTVKDLALFIHQHETSMTTPSTSSTLVSTDQELDNETLQSGESAKRQTEVSVPFFSAPPHLIQLGHLVCRLATDCLQQKVEGSSFHHPPGGSARGKGSSALSPDELELQLVLNIQTWLRSLRQEPSHGS
jgi:hypothetical protein